MTEWIRIKEALGLFITENVSFPEAESAIRTKDKAAHVEFNECGEYKDKKGNKNDPPIFFDYFKRSVIFSR